MKNKLVIFDMDWVISDTQKFHSQIEIDILKSYWILTINPTDITPITEERINKNFAWVQPKEWMKELFTIHKKSEIFNIEHIEKQKAQMLNELYNNKTTKIEIKYILA